jgi:hypothetical protein
MVTKRSIEKNAGCFAIQLGMPFPLAGQSLMMFR